MIHAIILVVPQSHVKRIRKFLKDLGFKKVTYVVAGGKRRQDSVARGLALIQDKRGIVIIHDAVRPLVSRTLISRGIRLCKKHKSAIPALRVRDTVKRVKQQRVAHTIPRHDLYLVQTPQFYDLLTIRKVFLEVDFRIEYTDEAAMLEALGMPVYVFRGDQQNIKVTDKTDLRFVRRILA
jgi:2-C-methyl-D-erythritol 4-phosphate cytidylyltransferase